MAHFTKEELTSKKNYLRRLKIKHATLMKEHSNTEHVRDCHNMLSEPFVALEFQLRFLMKQIKEIENDIRNANIVDLSYDSDENPIIAYGNCVVIQYLSDNEKETIVIRHLDDDVFNENCEFTICTPDSPLGKILIGKTKGFKGTYSTSRFKNIEVEVLEVLPPLKY